MTHNQIDYARLQEESRAHRATEFETNRNNVVMATETNRHNMVTEQETNRHNVSTENETNRHNLASESNDQQRNIINQQHYERMDAETRRHQLQTEQEEHRSNVATEAIRKEANAINWENATSQRIQAAASATQASAAMRNASTNAAQIVINSQLADIQQQQANTALLDAMNRDKSYDAAWTQAKTAASIAESTKRVNNSIIAKNQAQTTLMGSQNLNTQMQVARNSVGLISDSAKAVRDVISVVSEFSQ